MKKFLLAFSVLAATAGTAMAQLNAGSVFIGGSAGFTSTSREVKGTGPGGSSVTVKYDPTTTFTIAPMVGYMLTNRWAVGGQIGYDLTSSPNGETGPDNEALRDRQSLVFINPLARYYFMFNDNAGLFFQGNVGVGFGTSESEREDNNGVVVKDKGDLSRLEVGIRPGFTWFISDHVGLEVTYGFLGYNHIRSGDDDNYTKDSFFGIAASSGTQYTNMSPLTGLNIGFNYYLSRK